MSLAGLHSCVVICTSGRSVGAGMKRLSQDWEVEKFVRSSWV